jgi:predicted nucleic acid-binding protein
MKIVIDTNVIVSAIQAGDSISRGLLRLAFMGEVTVLMSNALFLEYEAIRKKVLHY